MTRGSRLTRFEVIGDESRGAAFMPSFRPLWKAGEEEAERGRLAAVVESARLLATYPTPNGQVHVGMLMFVWEVQELE